MEDEIKENRCGMRSMRMPKVLVTKPEGYCGLFGINRVARLLCMS